MTSPSRLARKDVLTILADEALGFNTRASQLAEEWGIEALPLDFTPDSRNVIEANIQPDNEDWMGMFADPLSLVVATTGMVNAKSQNAAVFSGLVEVLLRFVLRWSDDTTDERQPATRARDAESHLDMVEAAVLGCLNNTSQALMQSTNYNMDFRSDRSEIEQLGNGWIQSIDIILAIEVII